jgi:uncharacterized protein DUF6289
MKLTKSLRVFGIVASLIGITATQSPALPPNELEIVYFSDATYTNEVGYMFRACNGGVYKQGKTSRYRVTSPTPCHGSQLPAEIACFLDGVLTTCPANICTQGCLSAVM